MELLSAVRAMAVPDHPEVLEHIERPVDGGWDRVRIACATSLDEVDIVPAELGTWAGAIGAAIHGAESMAPVAAALADPVA